MKQKKRLIFSIIFLFFVVLININPMLNSIFVVPVSNLIVNFKNGNFTENSLLHKHGVSIELDKCKWTYHTKDMGDRIIVNFSDSLINGRYSIKQKATLHIIKDEIPKEILTKLYAINIKECDKTHSILEDKNTHQGELTFCTQGNATSVLYDVPEKRIMITYYPYIESEKSRGELAEFLKGIVIKAD